MTKRHWAIGMAACALILAALGCVTPDVNAGGATGQAVQQTVIAGLTQANIQITPDDSEVTMGAAFVQTAIAAKINATIDAAIAGTQTAIAPQPPPATITVAPTQEGDLATNLPPQPTSAAPTDAPGTGSVTGKLCYPAAVLPPVTIYAKDVSSGAVFQQENPAYQTVYTFANLPPGSYYFFAYTHTGPDNPTSIGIGYTQYVVCGLQASCPDHSMIAVAVSAGLTTPGVDICDGYDASAIPPQP